MLLGLVVSFVRRIDSNGHIFPYTEAEWMGVDTMQCLQAGQHDFPRRKIHIPDSTMLDIISMSLSDATEEGSFF